MRRTIFIIIIILSSGMCLPATAQSLFNYRVETVEEAEKKLNTLRNLSYEYLDNNQTSSLNKVLDGKVILDMPGLFVDTLRAFYKEEVLLYRYLLFDFEYLSRAITNEPLLKAIPDSRERIQILVPMPDDLLESLLKIAVGQKQTILASLENTALADYQKEFISLYFDYLLIQSEIESFDKEELVSRAKTYLEKYPHNPYTSFVEENINLSYRTSDFGIGSGLFAGANVFTEPLSNQFSGGVPVGGFFDLAYKRLYLYLQFNGSFGSKVRETFTYENEPWEDNTRTTIATGGGSLGFTIIDKEKYSITPFVGINSVTISSFIRSEDRDEITLKVSDFPVLHSGINFDYKIKHQASITSYHERFIADHDKTYWNIRFRAGFMAPQFNADYPELEGNLFYVGVGVGIFTFPAVQVKDKNDY
ncbi:MAG: hypothetical protein ACOC0C_09225 [Bacteroidota bacterium]